jgi:hypothetical protein
MPWVGETAEELRREEAGVGWMWLLWPVVWVYLKILEWGQL